MLSFLNAQGAGRIATVTINGGGATNEIPVAKHSLEFYAKDKVQHFTHTIDSSLFEVLPNIVWILEGYMFQSGVFLRYALSALVRDIGRVDTSISENIRMGISRLGVNKNPFSGG